MAVQSSVASANAELAIAEQQADAGPSTAPQLPNNEHRPQQHQRRGGQGGPTSLTLRRRLAYIPARAPIIVRLGSKFKTIELHPGTNVSLGKCGVFRADDLIGLPFGLTFEIANDSESANSAETNGHGENEPPPKKRRENGKKGKGAADSACGRLRVVQTASLQELTDNQATNEMIGQDGQSAQMLTYLDIKALKEAGAEGKDIVQRQVESSASFQQRTSWSQQKFVLRKQAKHLRHFTPIPPTLTNVTRYVGSRFDKEINEKIRGLRADSLSSILSQAGIAPGRRFIVIDAVGGLLAGAILERMGGEGRLLALNDADSPPAFDLMNLYNLPSAAVDPVLRSMHWACTDRDWQSIVAPDDDGGEVTPAGKRANDRDRQRFKKRRAAHNELERTRTELFEGGWDGLIVASPYDPCSIIERLLPFLAGSSNVVVHSPQLEMLIKAHARLRLLHSLIDVSVAEPWMRPYQVLPGRTHPEMTTSSSGGYILHAIRVLTDDETRKMMEARERTNSDAQA